VTTSSESAADRVGESGGAPRSRDERKALQRRNILDAARQVFFRDGFIAANLDVVAQLAGVAKGTLYRYFDNKAELYVAVLAKDGQVFEGRLREAARSTDDPVEQIRRVGRFYYEHWTSHREYFQIFWALENQAVIGALPPEVVEAVEQLWEECLRVLADVVRGGVERGVFAPCDAWVAANVLWTTANGLIQSETIESRRHILGERSPSDVFDTMVEMMLRALRA
jgi:AcrR family transcriptional regulator